MTKMYANVIPIRFLPIMVPKKPEYLGYSGFSEFPTRVQGIIISDKANVVDNGFEVSRNDIITSQGELDGVCRRI